MQRAPPMTSQWPSAWWPSMLPPSVLIRAHRSSVCMSAQGNSQLQQARPAAASAPWESSQRQRAPSRASSVLRVKIKARSVRARVRCAAQVSLGERRAAMRPSRDDGGMPGSGRDQHSSPPTAFVVAHSCPRGCVCAHFGCSVAVYIGCSLLCRPIRGGWLQRLRSLLHGQFRGQRRCWVVPAVRGGTVSG